MVPVRRNAPFHWTVGDIVGPILFVCFSVAILILLFWKRARCCIPCCRFFDKIRGKQPKEDNHRQVRLASQKPRHKSTKSKAERPSRSQTAASEDHRKLLERDRFPAHLGQASQAPLASAATKDFDREDRRSGGRVLEQPIKANIKGVCSAARVSAGRDSVQEV